MKNMTKYLLSLGAIVIVIIVASKKIKDTVEVIIDLKEDIKQDLGFDEIKKTMENIYGVNKTEDKENIIENVKYTFFK